MRLVALLAVLCLTAAGLLAPGGAAAQEPEPATDDTAELGSSEAPELRELWTDSSRTYKLDETTYRTELFSEPVNFQDSKGAWTEIDTALQPSTTPGFAWENAAGPVQVLFPPSLADGPVRIEHEGSWVEFSLQDAKGAPTVEGSTITYAGALPGVSVSYEVTATGVKESLILDGPSSERSFAFDVKDSADVSLKETKDGGMEVVDAAGEPAFQIEDPYAVDAAGKEASSDQLAMDLAASAKGAVVELTPDATWLDAPERTWPVVVDPTVELPSTSSRDCFINEASKDQSKCMDYTIQVGREQASGTKHRGLLYFDLSGLPGTVIEPGATLRLYCGGQNGTDLNVQVQQVSVPAGDAWTPWGPTTWNQRKKPSLNWILQGGDFEPTVWASSSVDCQAAGYKDWTGQLTDLIQGWVDGAPNDGIILTVGNTGTVKLLDFSSGDNPTKKPKLVVNSSRPNGLEGGGFQNVVAVNPDDANIVVSGGDVAGVHLSRDGGATWSSQNTGMQNQQQLKVAALAWDGPSTLYALVGTGEPGQGGVLRGTVETDEDNVANGVWIHWQQLATPLALVGNGGNPDSGTGLPGDDTYPQQKAPGAATSTAKDAAKGPEHPRSVGQLLVIADGYLYAGSYHEGVFRALLTDINDGDPIPWTNLGLAGEYVRSIEVGSGVLYAATYRSTTQTWTPPCEPQDIAQKGHVFRIKNLAGTPMAPVELTGSPINVEELRFIDGTMTLYGVADERDSPCAVYEENGTKYVDPGTYADTWVDPLTGSTYRRGLFRLVNPGGAGAVTQQWPQTSDTAPNPDRPDVSTGTDPCATASTKNQIWYSLDGYKTQAGETVLWTGARNPACELAGGQRIGLTRLSSGDGWTNSASAARPSPSAPPTTVLGTTYDWWVGKLGAKPDYMLGKGTFTASDVAVAPTNTSVIYAAGRSGIWKTSNDGATWAPAVRSMAVTINRDVLVDPTSAGGVDVANVDYQYLASTDGMQSVARTEVSNSDGVTAGYALARAPVASPSDSQDNALFIGLANRNANTGGEVWWRGAGGGTWTRILSPQTDKRPIGLLAIRDPACTQSRRLLAAVAGQGVFESAFTGTGYQALQPVSAPGLPSMLAGAGLKQASFVRGAAGSKNVYLYDKGQGVFRGTWSCSGGTWSWTEWKMILDYPSSGDASGYLAPDLTDPNVLYVTSAGDATHAPRVFKITDATTAPSADPDRTAVKKLATGSITDPGPIDVDPDGRADSDDLASIVIVEPATSTHDVRLWTVDPANAETSAKWKSRELDGLTAQPLVPLDMDYDGRDGHLYIATFGIGVYTAYLPKPGPA